MRKVIFLFLMLLPLPLQAEISICKPKLAILYANGVWNSQDDARESFDNFYNKLYPILDKEHQKRIEYTGTLYNYNQGYMDDLLEVYTQKSGENYDAFWDWYLEVKTPPDWWVDFYNKMYHGPR
jgi:hypothetical protein